MRRFLSFSLLTLFCCLSVFSACAADTGMLYSINDSDNSLYAIDPNTFAATYIGSTGVGTGDYGDLAFNPATNTAYWAPGRGNDNLYTINLQTGAATLVGYHGVDDLFALGFDTATNTLYGETIDGNFYSLSTSNGAATQIGSNGLYGGGMTYRADTDQLVLLAAASARFWAINPTTGNPTYLGGNGFVDNDGLAWDPVQGKFFVADWRYNLYTADPNTYLLTQVADLPGPFDGLIYVGQIPEPGTFLLIGSGLLGLATRLRRKL